MLTVFDPAFAVSERNGIERGNIRLGAHCTERPEVNQDKPNLKPCLRKIPRPSTSTACAADALGTRRRLRRRSGISPLYDVKQTACGMTRGGKGCSLTAWMKVGGARRDRTDDLKLAKLALSQLSYGPDSRDRRILRGRSDKTSGPSRARAQGWSAAARKNMVGLGRFELPTSRLSSARSNQLSYRPKAQASMRRKRNVGGGVPLCISSG